MHFSSSHDNYYSAWKHVTKEDDDVLESQGHPDLRNRKPPRTAKATRQVRRKPRKRRQSASKPTKTAPTDVVDGEDALYCNESPKKKRKRLTPFEISEIILEKGIKAKTELFALAFEQKMEGKTDVAEFIINRGPKVVAEVLSTALDLRNSRETLKRSKQSRLDILYNAANGECATDCNGKWIQCAIQVLRNNAINVSTFQNAVKELLVKGRGKYRNIMIVGPANCGKTFMLNPLNVIYKTFCNPACSSFAWVGAEQSECIFLNDFRWSQQVIPWHDLLLMLEGQIVHLPAPKTHYAKDIVFDEDTPIFCSGKQPLLFLKHGIIDQTETEMMAVRWRVFKFTHQISQEQQQDIPVCPKCFARFILSS